jgi:hypothetical protein
VPAIAAAWLLARGIEPVVPAAIRLGPAGRALVLVALVLPVVAWHARSARVSYPGFQGGSQVEFVLARHGPDETAPAVPGGAPRTDRASVGDLARRVYRTLAWGHVFYLPVTAYYPLYDLLKGVQFRTRPGLLIVFPAWIALAAGGLWLWRVRPLAPWLVALNVAVLLVLPWPDGTHVRYLVPLVPLVAATAAVGVVRLAGRRIGLALLALLCAVSLWVTLDRARFRADHPYIEPEFGNLVALLSPARATLEPGDAVVVDESVEGVAYALTGVEELPMASALQQLDAGNLPRAVFVSSPSTPRLMEALRQRLQTRPQLRVADIEARGESRLFRLVREP